MKFDNSYRAPMPLLSEYLNLRLMKPFFNRKSKYLTSCSDVIGRETLEVLLTTLEVMQVTCRQHFFPKEIEQFFVEILLPKTKPLIVGIIYRPPNQSNFLDIVNLQLKLHSKTVLLSLQLYLKLVYKPSLSLIKKALRRKNEDFRDF